MEREILQFVRFAHVTGAGKAFKALGATWDGKAEGWQVPASKVQEAGEL